MAPAPRRTVVVVFPVVPVELTSLRRLPFDALARTMTPGEME
jgi:hypothetical protein